MGHLCVVNAQDTSDPHQIPPTVKAILQNAESLEVLSLEPTTPTEPPEDAFHGWKVLGRKTLDQSEQRKKLIAVFSQGVSEYTGGGFRCFIPRHGLRVKHKDQVADLVICFECSHVRAYVDGESEKSFLISDSPADLFNEILRTAGVPLPEQPQKRDNAKREGEVVTDSLQGKCVVASPVNIQGPFSEKAKIIKVGDSVLLQVAYESRNKPKKVSAKVSVRAMTARIVFNTGKQLHQASTDKTAPEQASEFFAILLKANTAGECDATIHCEMSDGTVKVVPFKFQIEE
jgi:hypothetical protein